MKDLIKITKHEIGTEDVNSVNAREIHIFLGVKTRFDMWIDRAIKKYDFKENVDYVVMLKTVHNSKGGRKAKDYIVTIDMAKELSMLENNAKGKETRKYFISCEKKVLSGAGANSDIINMMAQQNSMMMEFMKTQSKQSDMVIELLKDMKQSKKDEVKTVNSKQITALRNAISIFSTKRQEMNPQNNLSQTTRFSFTELNSLMGVNTYTDIPACEFDTAMSYIKKATEIIDKDLKDKKLKNKIDMAKDLKELMNDMPIVEF